MLIEARAGASGSGNFAAVQPPYAGPAPESCVVIPRNTAAKARTVVELRQEVVAPVHAGQGRIVAMVAGEELARFPRGGGHGRGAGRNLARGGILRRAVDSDILFFRAI